MWVRVPAAQSDSEECPANLQDEQQTAQKCVWYLPANG